MIEYDKRIEELIEIAKSATPGRWTYDSCGDINANSVSDAIGTTLFYSSENVDAKFIATFNPAFVLKLLESWLDFYTAADGLKYGADWNNGTHAQVHRPKLLEALKKADKVFE